MHACMREVETAINNRGAQDGENAALLIGDGASMAGNLFMATAANENAAFWMIASGAGANRPVTIYAVTRDVGAVESTNIETIAYGVRRVLRIEIDAPNSEVRYYVNNVLEATHTEPASWNSAGGPYAKVHNASNVAADSSIGFYFLRYYSTY